MIAAPDGLPPLREVIRRHGLIAKKSLGQNFLLDLNLAARIARAAGRSQARQSSRSAPGRGMTRALLALGADRVIAVERESAQLPRWHEIAEPYPVASTSSPADALTFDPRSAPRPPVSAHRRQPPYNIATALLVAWVSRRAVAALVRCRDPDVPARGRRRIVAGPGSKSYGRLSVLVQWRCEARILFDVNASAFVPPPKVTSSVVRFLPRAHRCLRPSALKAVTQAAFGQRRKMLARACARSASRCRPDRGAATQPDGARRGDPGRRLCRVGAGSRRDRGLGHDAETLKPWE